MIDSVDVANNHVFCTCVAINFSYYYCCTVAASQRVQPAISRGKKAANESHLGDTHGTNNHETESHGA